MEESDMIYPDDYVNKVIQGDCLEIMKGIPDASIDMILTDLPYGQLKTAHKWDSPIPLDELWKQYKRIIKPRSATVLFGNQPFSSRLIVSNIEQFKYELVWDKGRPGNIYVGKLRPLSYHENLLVFSDGAVASGSKRNMRYTPQMIPSEPRVSEHRGIPARSFARESHNGWKSLRTEKYPSTIARYPKDSDRNGHHPTQKPVSLLEWLIKSYTNEGDLVLDSCCGSGSTLVAARNTNRNYIGIELLPEYVEIARKRIETECKTP
jgi:site-specific DNA-methyltransferase (adenine-specific)